MTAQHAIDPKLFGRYWVSAIDIVAREIGSVQLHTLNDLRPCNGPCDRCDEPITVAEITVRLSADNANTQIAAFNDGTHAWSLSYDGDGRGYYRFPAHLRVPSTWEGSSFLAFTPPANVVSPPTLSVLVRDTRHTRPKTRLQRLWAWLTRQPQPFTPNITWNAPTARTGSDERGDTWHRVGAYSEGQGSNA